MKSKLTLLRFGSDKTPEHQEDEVVEQAVRSNPDQPIIDDILKKFDPATDEPNKVPAHLGDVVKREYLKAGDVLVEQIDGALKDFYVAAQDRPDLPDADAVQKENQAFLGRLNRMGKELLDAREKADAIVESLAATLRQFKIAVIGNPDNDIPIPNLVTSRMVTVTVLLGSVIVELMLGISTFRAMSNTVMAYVGATVLALIMSGTAYFFADSVRAWKTNFNARKAYKQYVKGGGTPLTGGYPDITDVMSTVVGIAAGALWLVFGFGTLWLRLSFIREQQMHNQAASMNGVYSSMLLMGVTALYVVYYLWKGDIKHPWFREYQLKADELETAKKAQQALSGANAPELVALVSEYKAWFAGHRDAVEQWVARMNGIKGRIERLWSEYQGLPKGFSNRFIRLVKYAFGAIVTVDDDLIANPAYNLAASGRLGEIQDFLKLPEPKTPDGLTAALAFDSAVPAIPGQLENIDELVAEAMANASKDADAIAFQRQQEQQQRQTVDAAAAERARKIAAFHALQASVINS